MYPESGRSAQIFADGACLSDIVKVADDERVSGFTTNPLLLEQAGVRSYAEFASMVIDSVGDERPVSFEVLSTRDAVEIRRQARTISKWGPNAVVKIPVVAANGAGLEALIRDLSQEGMVINVTAICTMRQAETAVEALIGGPGGYVSVFAGRIADTGRDPAAMIGELSGVIGDAREVRRIWASPRQVGDWMTASRVGCEVITLTPALIAKLSWLGRSLDDVSLETVRQFEDAARRTELAL